MSVVHRDAEDSNTKPYGLKVVFLVDVGTPVRATAPVPDVMSTVGRPDPMA